MSEIYPTNLSEEEIERVAEEMILSHGHNAVAEISKEIRTSNSRGDFTLSGLWVLVAQRTRQLQAPKYPGDVLNENATLVE